MHVLLIGSGEYTVGIPPTSTDVSGVNQTDKKLGVVALTMIDLKRRFGDSLVSKLSLCGTRGDAIKTACDWIATSGLSSSYKQLAPFSNFDSTWPSVGVRDVNAYKAAIDALSRGSAVTIFTPDNTHFDIALYAVEHYMHVILAKPAVMNGNEHRQLLEAARNHDVIVCVEFHKRFDPIYSDARSQIRNQAPDLTYFYAFMSQPKYQLETFRLWAGVSSDISYYLNAHHVDFLLWAMQGRAVPVKVMAMGSRGVANSEPYNCHASTDDSITLQIELKHLNEESHKIGVAVVTSGWTAPNKAECHSQQRFHFMNSSCDVRIDQAHRGYEMTTDQDGYKSRNPLFMNYTVGEGGAFIGQEAYGYRSFQVWLETCQARNKGQKDKYDSRLAYLEDVVGVTAVLEAGKLSQTLRKPVDIVWDDSGYYSLQS